MGGTTPREGQTFGGESLLVRYANFVKLPHTVFALPFALLGLVVASRETALTWRTLGLVVLAFTCARFVALGFNRIADRELDARNPRTQVRELPSGRLTLRQACVAVVVAAVVFLATAWALNPLCLALAPLALVFISAYSYAKRFTHWSHLWLGLADGLASLVVRLGQAGAILAAKVLHGVALVALVLFGMGAGLGVAYYVGVAVGAALIAWEHRLVKPGDLSRLNAAFFTANGIVSIVVFLGALVDRVL